jgi:uncharacterized protein (DUF885 family)
MQRINQRKLLSCSAAIAAGLFLGCGSIGPVAENMDPLTDMFAYEPLAMDPVTATEVGYHEHKTGSAEGEGGGQTVNLDEQLGDYSSAGIAKRVEFYQGMRTRLNTHETNDDVPERDKLNSDRWANYGVMQNRIDRALFRLETEKPFENDPNFYVAILGRGLSTPLTLEYAGADARFGHIIARLEKTPDLLATAKSNLRDTSALQAASAVEELEGLKNLIDGDIKSQLPGSLAGSFGPAAEGAIAAIDDFAAAIKALPNQRDWRAGRSMFEQELVAMGAPEGTSIDEVLASLDAEFQEAYKKVIEAAAPIHRGIYGGQRAPSDYALMRDILEVSDRYRLRTADGLLDQVRQDVEEAKAFLKDKELLPIPEIPLHVTDTPPFLRAQAPVDAFQAPPLLNAAQGASYWITPIPASWSATQTRDKLREFNNFKLKIVAVDGYARFVQAALAAEGENPVYRLVRNVDGNRAFVRGFPWYMIDSTIADGYQGRGGQFQLVWWKYKLEQLASAMLDIKLHTGDMSEDDAETMLERQVFMETGAIAGTLRRIQLAPTDATLAYVGARQWQLIRRSYQEATQDFSPQSFHGKALRAGAMPGDEVVYITTEGQGRLAAE